VRRRRVRRGSDGQVEREFEARGGDLIDLELERARRREP
jgi:hypothetical protein